MNDAITVRIDGLIEASKMLQNKFLHFLIRNKLAKILEEWNRNSEKPALSVIPGMPKWIHNLQQYCVDQLEINNRYQVFCNKFISDDEARSKITEKDVDTTMAIQLLLFEHYFCSRTVVGDKSIYKRYLDNSRISRNVFSHYTPKTSNDTKMADIKNLLDDLEIFIDFIISDLNARNESTIELSNLKNELEELRIKYKDIVGEREEHIQYLSKITAYVNKIKYSFIEMVSKFVRLDIDKENIKGYTSSYVDEILTNDKTIPRCGKIEDIVPTIEKKKMMLTGGPGAGKSTTLSFLAYRDALEYLSGVREGKESVEIPILLHLNTLTKEDVSVIEKIAEDLKISPEQVKDLLNKDNLRIYLDGLNEIPNASESILKQKRITEIREMADCYPKTLIVCTTREVDAQYLDNFSCFRVLPMSDSLVKEFIQKNAQSNTVKDMLLQEFEKTVSLIKSIKTPLYVTRLIAVVSETGKMPKNEVEIIGKYLKNLLKRERFDKAANIDPIRIEDLLSEFAYVVREKYKTNVPISYSNIIEIFHRKQIYSKDKLYDILNLCIELEIISIADESRNLYAFAHETYQEYYRANVEDFTI